MNGKAPNQVHSMKISENLYYNSIKILPKLRKKEGNMKIQSFVKMKNSIFTQNNIKSFEFLQNFVAISINEIMMN